MIRMILYCVDYSMIYSVYPYDTTRVNFGGPHMFSSRYNIVYNIIKYIIKINIIFMTDD